MSIQLIQFKYVLVHSVDDLHRLNWFFPCMDPSKQAGSSDQEPTETEFFCFKKEAVSIFLPIVPSAT